MQNTKYPVNFDDIAKPYCWSKSRRFAYLMSVEDFRESVRDEFFIDYDGSGTLLVYRDGDYYPMNIDIWPSIVDEIPPQATHIDWFNR